MMDGVLLGAMLAGREFTLADLRALNVRLPPMLTREEYEDMTMKAYREGFLDMTNPLTIYTLKYYWDLNRFVRETFFTPNELAEGKGPDGWQDDVMLAISDGNRRIAVRSGHGVGKTACIAWVNIWFMIVFTPAKLVVTAPAAGTMEDGMGNEIKLWIDRTPGDIRSLFNMTGDRVVVKQAASENFLTMRTSRPENPQAIAGIHAPHVCITVDEASALKDESFETVGSSMTAGHALLLLIGNPTLRTGYFYECFHRMRDMWVCFHVNSETSARVDREYIEDIEKRFGKQSNVYRVRVQGEFPLGDDDSIIPGHLVEESVGRKVALLNQRPIWGLDVARSLNRDKSVLVKRKGNSMLPTDPNRLKEGSLHTPLMLRWQYPDTTQLIGSVKQEWDNTPETQRPLVICVDGIGFGAVVCDVLRSMGLPAIAINVSERKAKNSNYVNLRAELWFVARDWFVGLLSVLPVKDGQLMEELMTVEQKIMPDGRLMAEDKDSLRKRKGWSPDGADAFILTFGVPSAYAEAAQMAQASSSAPLKRRVGGLV